jgi:glycerophosphoryl diester phosphodiesterase
MSKSRIISILLPLLIGGQMSFGAEKSTAQDALPWVGKFPVLVIAHRGSSGAAPENTLTAFRRAMEVGSDMLELDVHLSKDGQVVVIHDDTIDRTTNRKGKVANYTLDELKQLDVGTWFGSQFSGEKIPALREVLDLARGRILVNIELKEGDHGQYTILDLADRTIQEVERAGMLEQVLFSSFDPTALERTHKNNSKAHLALLYNKRWDAPQEIVLGRPFSFLNCRKTVLRQSNISRAHQEGFKVMVYTLTTEEEMKHFVQLGVDGIITNYPDHLIEILRKK